MKFREEVEGKAMPDSAGPRAAYEIDIPMQAPLDRIPPELVYEFDPHIEPDFDTDPFGVYERMLKDAPDVFYAPNFSSRGQRGSWIVKSAEGVREVLQNADPFSTSILYGGDDANWPRTLVPLMIDPPEHLKYRALIAPLFSPRAIDSMEDWVYEVVNETLDTFIADGKCNFMNQFARIMPGTIFMKLMGLPAEKKEQFFEWEEAFFHGGTEEDKSRVGEEIAVYLNQLIEEKRANPGDDMISMLTKAEVDGKPIPLDIVQDFCFLLYIAGLDTVNAGLGHMFKYLAEHPERQQELRDHPERVPGAVEEMLRWHSWVLTSRVLSRDYDFHGAPMKKYDRVELMVTMASRDEREFSDPYKIDFERLSNPHFAFAAGVHRCVGSHLARRELRIALQEWVRRVPEFHIQKGTHATYFTDGMLALKSLPLEWDASKVTK